ncbi:MAG: hypothetical protein ABII79_12705 [bacterium]
MTRAIPFILYLLLIALHEVITRDVTAISMSVINIAALIVLVVGIYKRELVVVWFGFAAGLVLVPERPDVLGWHALVLAAVGLATFHIRERFNLESLYSRLVLIFGGVLLHNVLVLMINGGHSLAHLCLVSALPGAVYTAAIGWLFFLFKEGKITYRKIRSLF